MIVNKKAPDYLLQIISVTKNDLDGIRRTIQSTKSLRATGRVTQLIVDSSEQEIAGNIQETIQLEENMTYKWMAPKGIASAFNFGIKKSNATWLWFLNGGDSFLNTFNISSLLDVIELNNSDIIVFSTKYKKSGIVPQFPPIWMQWPLFGSWIPHPSTIIRHSVFHAFGNYSTAYKTSMDFDYWLKCFSGKVVVNLISIPITSFDETGESSINKRKTAREGLLSILKNSGRILNTEIKRIVIHLSNILSMIYRGI